ncbi:putative RNA-directed DNA polymerase [Tanacetum coccineum]
MQQARASVSSYYTKLRGLWEELEMVMSIPRCTCVGCKCDIGKRMVDLRENERLYEFLMGLDNKFVVIWTQILAIDPFPKLRNAHHLVVEDERQRVISSEKRTMVDSAAFKTFSHDGKETNTNQQRDKTIIQDNKHNETSEICSECGKEGHTRQGCFKLIGYPEWWPRNKKRDDSNPKAACGSARRTKDDTKYDTKDDINLTAFTSNIVLENDWLIDSGDFIPVEGKGECTLTEGSKIKGVLYIPKFTCNLLSVSRLCKNLQSAITFFPGLCIMQKLNTRSLIGAGECRSGLYWMGIFGTEKKALMTTTNIWHSRLGHASAEKLSLIVFLKNVTFNKLCNSCSRAKHTILLFQNSVIKTSDCFESG